MTSGVEIPKHSAVAPPPPARGNGNGNAGAAAASFEGGSYDVIRKRLLEQAAELATRAESLDEKRKKVFDGAELALTATERARTEQATWRR